MFGKVLNEQSSLKGTNNKNEKVIFQCVVFWNGVLPVSTYPVNYKLLKSWKKETELGISGLS